MTELILQSLYSGLLAGGAYGLMALGIALVFGTMRVINLAHGELVLLAAYIAYAFESGLGWNPMATIPVALCVVCTAGAATYYLVDRIKQDRELNSLILTYGIGIILTNAMLLIWKADIHSTSVAWYHADAVFGPFYSMRAELFFFGVSVALLLLLWWWLARTWYGRAVRAVASNKDAAKLMGINPRRTEVISFVVAGVLATFAGIALYSTSVIQPSLGHALTIKAFVITVLAGLGSIPGVLVGALLLGVIESLTVTLWSSAMRDLVGMVLFLVVLLVLPNGLFGLVRRRG
jgi:branched-chain amino acid transport system permease protein